MTPLLAQRPRTDRAFERIYRRHVGDVYRYALAVMRNESDAEDVTQTTFLNAYRAFQRGDRPDKPHNWLIAIAHNVCRQRFRQASRRPAEVAFDEDVGSTLVAPDDVPSGEDIRRALGQLAFNQRAALVMRELEGRSYSEIAEILELSPSAVETLLFRARRALREQLESTITCGAAELAISKQLDGRLDRQDKGALRAHLRACPACARFARRQRAQRAAVRSLAAVPVPTSLTSLFGGGAGVTGGLAVKAAVAVTAGAALGGAGYTGVHAVVSRHARKPPAAVAPHVTPVVGRSSPSGVPAVLHSHNAHVATRGTGVSARHGRGHAQTNGAAAAHRRSHARHRPRMHPRPPTVSRVSHRPQPSRPPAPPGRIARKPAAPRGHALPRGKARGHLK